MLLKLRNLEAQVNHRADQLEKAKASFLKNIYHEIRTPLNSIVGFTSLLEQRQVSPSEAADYMKHINSSSRDFLRIMDDIIQASLLEAKMVSVHNEACNLYLVLEELHAFFSIRKHIMEKNHIALLCTVPNELRSLNAHCDPHKLNQVLSQLMHNALKFSDKGVVEYGFKLEQEEVVFYVKDSGIGDIEGKEEYVFRSFTKMDTSDGAQDGLGLGLVIAKSLVELMGGKIWYDSKLEQGTSFYFSIPFVGARDEEVKKDVVQEELNAHYQKVIKTIAV